MKLLAPRKEQTMQTNSEVLFSRQEVFRQAIPKQAPKIAQIRDVRGITPNAKFAMLLLHSREPNIFPSMKTLAADMVSSVSTAKRAVRELKRAGYLRATPRIGKTNLYSLTVTGAPPPLASMPPPPCQADTPPLGHPDPPPLSPVPPPPVTHDTPPLGHPDPPPQVTHAPPPRSPMTPEVAREVYKVRSKRERKRTLSPGIHSLKETLTCPKCEHTWPKDYGPVCHTCRMDIGIIQRRIDEGKQAGEKSYADRLAEIEAVARSMEERQQASTSEEAKTPVQKPQAEEPQESPEEVEAARLDMRKELYDLVSQPYDAAILEHLAKVAGTA